MNADFKAISKIYKILKMETNSVAKQSRTQICDFNDVHLQELSHDTLIINNKDAKRFLKDIISPTSKIQSIWAACDWGRAGDFSLFFKKVKLYNAIDKKTGKNTDYITCYKDKLKRIQKIIVYNCKNKDMKIFDAQGKIRSYYSPEETFSLMSYKHDSSNIHKLLRYGTQIKDKEKFEKCINSISQIFQSGKAMKTTEDLFVYRVLDRHSLNALKSMKKDGLILEDPSFTSVTTKKSQIYKFINFKNFNKILKIKIPKGTDYIDMDEIHSIVMQASEHEWLLNKKCKLLIKNTKGKNGIIDAELIKLS